ncbi:hypothetical protein GNX14_27090 [Mesorhizobium japonicum]|uniref:hypothetical protein n=1 Tax=Mesorhizobium TaxID=68287 RepID=UPI0007FB931C|nr:MULTISPECIES: hypothetical protein [Mesorhizobium]MUT24788.1 hypothetical protein [Mesorhizobium japonicum]OBQ95795.1 hypothetical protein A9K66_24575 [Mesorhizobium sp. AA23]
MLVVIIGAFLRLGLRRIDGETAFDHVGEDGARLGKIEGGDGRVHLLERLATAEQLRVDRADLVEELPQLVEIGQILVGLGDSGVGHIVHCAAARPGC